MSQEDGAANFTNNIFSRVSVYSNTNPDLSASNIERELSLSEISVFLPVNILLKKPVQRLKTNAEKKAALSYYIYAFVNKGKDCLQKIILKNYKK